MIGANVGAILLAGGTGTRMGGDTPKQYRMLGGKAIALHSFDILASSPSVAQVVVVCHSDYRHLFPINVVGIPVLFADPGPRRQDSVYNGLQALDASNDFVCIHDAARPFITPSMLETVLADARKYDAATLAVPLTVTVKQSHGDNMVHSTLDRSYLWEIQTPQVIRTSLLRRAFEYAIAQDLTVTDDVSLIEALGYPVKLVHGAYTNLKITTPKDLIVAECLFDRHELLALT